MSYHKHIYRQHHHHHHHHHEPGYLQVKRYNDNKKINRFISIGSLIGICSGMVIGAYIGGWGGFFVGLLAGGITGFTGGAISGHIAVDSN